MKEKIVIELEKTGDGYSASIWGQIDNKKTDKISGWFATRSFAIDCFSCGSNMVKIKQWMEQIR